MRDFASYLMDHMNEIKINKVETRDGYFGNGEFKVFREGIYCVGVHKVFIPWHAIEQLDIENV